MIWGYTYFWKHSYTTWKVDGATPMYWFIMAPYWATCWELRHLLSPQCTYLPFIWDKHNPAIFGFDLIKTVLTWKWIFHCQLRIYNLYQLIHILPKVKLYYQRAVWSYFCENTKITVHTMFLPNPLIQDARSVEIKAMLASGASEQPEKLSGGGFNLSSDETPWKVGIPVFHVFFFPLGEVYVWLNFPHEMGWLLASCRFLFVGYLNPLPAASICTIRTFCFKSCGDSWSRIIAVTFKHSVPAKTA